MLDPKVHEAEQVGKMLKPCPAELMECAEVSTLVNKPANNRAEMLEPVKSDS
jgi:putative SOS response-associated peptidase YedK